MPRPVATPYIRCPIGNTHGVNSGAAAGSTAFDTRRIA